MPEVEVTQHVTVPMADGRFYHVVPGVSDVPQEVADHAFVKAFAVGAPAYGKVYVVGPDGLMIEADEAGQLVQPSRDVSGYGIPGHTVLVASKTPEAAVAKAKNDAEAAAQADRAAADAKQAAPVPQPVPPVPQPVPIKNPAKV